MAASAGPTRCACAAVALVNTPSRGAGLWAHRRHFVQGSRREACCVSQGYVVRRSVGLFHCLDHVDQTLDARHSLGGEGIAKARFVMPWSHVFSTPDAVCFETRVLLVILS